jgi:DNA-nicking Smr family endonuclease
MNTPERDSPLSPEALRHMEQEQRLLLAGMLLLPDKDKRGARETRPGNTHPRKQKSSSTQRPPETAVDWSLDLHGKAADEAEMALEEAIATMEQHGLRTLRVVHGGSPGSYGPVQKQVEGLLRSRLSGRVSQWGIDPANPGATLLRIASREATAKPGPVTSRPVRPGGPRRA